MNEYLELPGWTVERFAALPSTQSYLRERLEQGPLDRHVVVASVQTQGVGRRGHDWQSPAGGLWISWARRRPGRPDPFTSLIAGAACVLGLRKGLRHDLTKKLTIKWPNDLLFESRKCGGVILHSQPTERQTTYLVGCGINLKVPPETLRDLPEATSLAPVLTQPVDPDRILTQILAAFESLVDLDSDAGRESTLAEIRPLLSTLSKPIRWTDPDGIVATGTA